MLELKVRDGESEVVLRFEHSLLSLSKWESKHKKPFMATPLKASGDLIDYFEDMLLDGCDPRLVYALSPKQLDQLSNYVNDPMTASSVPVDGKPSNELVTSELVYYWMTIMKIPFSAETWHFNRLMMLIQIAGFKAQPEKKRRAADMYNKWKDMNAANKKRLGTNG